MTATGECSEPVYLFGGNKTNHEEYQKAKAKFLRQMGEIDRETGMKMGDFETIAEEKQERQGATDELERDLDF